MKMDSKEKEFCLDNTPVEIENESHTEEAHQSKGVVQHTSELDKVERDVGRKNEDNLETCSEQIEKNNVSGPGSKSIDKIVESTSSGDDLQAQTKKPPVSEVPFSQASVIQSDDSAQDENSTHSSNLGKDVGQTSLPKSQPGTQDVFSTADCIHFRNLLFGTVEELKIRRATESENEARLTELVSEKLRLENAKDDLMCRLRRAESEYEEKIALVKKERQDEIKQLQHGKAKLLASIESGEKELKVLKEDIQTLQLSKYGVEKRLMEAERKFQLQSGHQESNMGQITELESTARTMARKQADLVNHQDRLQQNVAEAEHFNRKLMNINNHQQCETKAARDEIAALQAKLQQLGVELAQRPTDAQEQLASSKLAVTRLTQENEALKRTTEILKKQVDEAKEQNQESITSLSDCHQLLERHVEAASHNKAQADTYRAELEETSKNLQRLKEKYDKFVNQAQIEDQLQTDRISELKQQEGSLSSRLRMLQDDHEALIKSHADMEELNTKWAEKNCQLTSQVEVLEGKLNKPRSEAYIQTELDVTELGVQTEGPIMVNQLTECKPETAGEYTQTEPCVSDTATQVSVEQFGAASQTIHVHVVPLENLIHSHTQTDSVAVIPYSTTKRNQVEKTKDNDIPMKMLCSTLCVIESLKNTEITGQIDKEHREKDPVGDPVSNTAIEKVQLEEATTSSHITQSNKEGSTGLNPKINSEFAGKLSVRNFIPETHEIHQKHREITPSPDDVLLLDESTPPKLKIATVLADTEKSLDDLERTGKGRGKVLNNDVSTNADCYTKAQPSADSCIGLGSPGLTCSQTKELQGKIVSMLEELNETDENDLPVSQGSSVVAALQTDRDLSPYSRFAANLKDLGKAPRLPKSPRLKESVSSPVTRASPLSLKRRLQTKMSPDTSTPSRYSFQFINFPSKITRANAKKAKTTPAGILQDPCVPKAKRGKKVQFASQLEKFNQLTEESKGMTYDADDSLFSEDEVEIEDFEESQADYVQNSHQRKTASSNVEP